MLRYMTTTDCVALCVLVALAASAATAVWIQRGKRLKRADAQLRDEDAQSY